MQAQTRDMFSSPMQQDCGGAIGSWIDHLSPAITPHKIPLDTSMTPISTFLSSTTHTHRSAAAAAVWGAPRQLPETPNAKAAADETQHGAPPSPRLTDAMTSALKASFSAREAELTAELEDVKLQLETAHADAATAAALHRNERLTWVAERARLRQQHNKALQGESSPSKSLLSTPRSQFTSPGTTRLTSPRNYPVTPTTRKAVPNVVSGPTGSRIAPHVEVEVGSDHTNEEFALLQSAAATSAIKAEKFEKELKEAKLELSRTELALQCANHTEGDLETLMLRAATLESELLNYKENRELGEIEASMIASEHRILQKRLQIAQEQAVQAEKAAAGCAEDARIAMIQVRESQARQRQVELWLEKALADCDALHSQLVLERGAHAHSTHTHTQQSSNTKHYISNRSVTGENGSSSSPLTPGKAGRPPLPPPASSPRVGKSTANGSVVSEKQLIGAETQTEPETTVGITHIETQTDELTNEIESPRGGFRERAALSLLLWHSFTGRLLHKQLNHAEDECRTLNRQVTSLQAKVGQTLTHPYSPPHSTSPFGGTTPDTFSDEGGNFYGTHLQHAHPYTHCKLTVPSDFGRRRTGDSSVHTCATHAHVHVCSIARRGISAVRAALGEVTWSELRALDEVPSDLYSTEETVSRSGSNTYCEYQVHTDDPSPEKSVTSLLQVAVAATTHLKTENTHLRSFCYHLEGLVGGGEGGYGTSTSNTAPGREGGYGTSTTAPGRSSPRCKFAEGWVCNGGK